jgi:hypothetical protein
MAGAGASSRGAPAGVPETRSGSRRMVESQRRVGIRIRRPESRAHRALVSPGHGGFANHPGAVRVPDEAEPHFRDFVSRCSLVSASRADPSGWSPRRVMLNFGAVDYEATVWINGEQLGTHRGGQTPFGFDVTDVLRAGDSIPRTRQRLHGFICSSCPYRDSCRLFCRAQQVSLIGPTFQQPQHSRRFIPHKLMKSRPAYEKIRPRTWKT